MPLALTADRIALIALAVPMLGIGAAVVLIVRELRSIELGQLGIKAGLRALARRPRK